MHNSIVIRILFIMILFQKECVSVDDLPSHFQLGVRKGRSVEDGKYALCACMYHNYHKATIVCAQVSYV